MGILYFRLLIILNEEDSESTYYHIAVVMLRHFNRLFNWRNYVMSPNQLFPSLFDILDMKILPIFGMQRCFRKINMGISLITKQM